MAKLWKGRFAKATHPALEAFSESLSFDRALAEVDVEGSLAHAEMLCHVGLLTKREHGALARGLKQVREEIRTHRFVYRPGDEDIHMAIEARLTELVGDPARKLHTARSRNDQVATDLRLWTRDRLEMLDHRLAEAQRALVAVADREFGVVIPGYTHLQRAQPVLLSQQLLAYVEMLDRDRGRLADARRRLNRLPLGAGALAGTTLPIDRARVAKALHFDGLCENSMDAVSDRDFVVETLAGLALVAVHLSRFAEDAIFWTSTECGLARLDDAWSTGSSIMPQKRNPDVLELTRGKTGRVVGALMAMLTVLKGTPMTYNRDLQEDKEPLFDAVRTVAAALECLALFVPTLTFDRQRAAALLEGGFLDATVMAEYLVEKGLPFRRAHEAAGELVKWAERHGKRLSEIPLTAMKEVSPLFDRDVFTRLDPARAPAAYRSAGSAGFVEVKKALSRWKTRQKPTRVRAGQA